MSIPVPPTGCASPAAIEQMTITSPVHYHSQNTALKQTITSKSISGGNALEAQLLTGMDTTRRRSNIR